MNETLCVIKLFLQDKNIFDKYHNYLMNIENLDYNIKQILKCMEEYYTEYTDVSNISIDDFIVFYDMRYKLLKNSKVIKDLIEHTKEIITNESLIKDYLVVISNKHMASIATDLLVSIMEGSTKHSLDEVKDLLEGHLKSVSADIDIAADDTLYNKSLMDIVKEEVTESGLCWHIPFLTKNLGKMKGGTLTHVFATPNVGKTSFVCHLSAVLGYQLRNTDDCIIHFNNEQKEKIIRLRTIQSLCNKPVSWLIDNAERANEEIIKRGINKILLYGPANSLYYIEERIKLNRPKVVLIDQGVKVKFPGMKEKTEGLQQLYYFYREMAKKYNCDVISVGQAADSARQHNKKWLTQDDCANSKIDLPGECDTMIGINKDNTPIDNFIRYISICKDKVGAEETICQVRFNRATGRYEEIEGGS